MGCIRPAIISTRNHYWSAVAREKKTTCVEQHSSRAAHVFGGKLTSAAMAALVFANLLNFELVGLLAELFQADLGCRARLPAPLPHGHCTAARCGSTSGPSTAFGGNFLLKLCRLQYKDICTTLKEARAAGSALQSPPKLYKFPCSGEHAAGLAHTRTHRRLYRKARNCREHLQQSSKQASRPGLLGISQLDRFDSKYCK